MHITSDGKMVHFVHTDDSGERTATMTLWLEPQGSNHFLVKADPGAEGWVVDLIPTENGLTIDRTEILFHLSRPVDTDIPDWYGRKLEVTLGRMVERERKIPEAGNDGKPDTAVS